MRDRYATEIRRLAARIERADRRIAMATLNGKVKEVDAEKRVLRLVIGTSSEGEEVLSPWVRWQEAAAGGMKIHSEPKVGEQMKLVSRSGTVGELSIAEPATFDQDNEAPSKSSDTAVFEREGGRIELGPDGILLKGNVKIEGGFWAEGSHFQHNDKNVGASHGHVSAPPGGSGPPV